MLDENHQLYQLSNSLNWVGLEKELVTILGDEYGPAVRLVCGTVYLKSFFDLSTAEVIEKWTLCRYARYFCGGSIDLEDTTCFPVPQEALDVLISQLNNEAHDVMIKAILATSIDECAWQKNVSPTVH